MLKPPLFIHLKSEKNKLKIEGKNGLVKRSKKWQKRIWAPPSNIPDACDYCYKFSIAKERKWQPFDACFHMWYSMGCPMQVNFSSLSVWKEIWKIWMASLRWPLSITALPLFLCTLSNFFRVLPIFCKLFFLIFQFSFTDN